MNKKSSTRRVEMSTKKVNMLHAELMTRACMCIIKTQMTFEIKEALDGVAEAAQALEERCFEDPQDYTEEEKLDALDWFQFKNEELDSLLIDIIPNQV